MSIVSQISDILDAADGAKTFECAKLQELLKNLDGRENQEIRQKIFLSENLRGANIKSLQFSDCIFIDMQLNDALFEKH